MGKWPIVSLVIIGQTTSLLLYSIAPDLSWFYPIRILHALTLAAFAPTALAITQNLAPAGKRGSTIGVFLTSIGIAATIGPFLCTFLIQYVTYAQLFQIASIIPLTGLPPLLLIHRNKKPRMISNERKSLNPLESLKILVSSRNMLILTYLRLTFSFTNAFFITLFAIHLEENLLMLPSFIALLFGIKGTTNMLSRIPAGKIVDRIGHRIPIILAFTLLTIVFLMISETSTPSLLAIAMILYGAAHGVRAVTEWSMLGDCAPVETGNIATAYLSTMFNVGAALGAIIAGILSILFNSSVIFKLGAAVILSGSLIINLAETKPSHARAQARV